MKIIDLFEDVIKINPSIMNKIITPELQELYHAFTNSGFEIRIVGGAVRDILLGKNPKDIDLSSNATPKEMIEVFNRNGIRYVETGISHGTITAIINQNPYEITTLRIDTETTGRHAKVEYTTDFKKDSERRDLTINSMSLDFDGNLYDYFGGMDDLKNSRIKFVGDPDQRIKEDYLRLLRYIRFWGRLKNPSIDENTKIAIRNNTPGLKKISGERIWSEMKQILSGPSPENSMKLMCELDLAQNISLPCHNISHLDHFKSFSANPIGLLCLILDSTKDGERIANLWRFSNPEKHELIWLLIHKHSDLNLMKAEDLLVDGVNPNYIEQLSYVRNKPDIAQKISKWRIPLFPIIGDDLIALGMKPGKELGKTLAYLKNEWKKSRFKLSKEELLKLINKQ